MLCPPSRSIAIAQNCPVSEQLNNVQMSAAKTTAGCLVPDVALWKRRSLLRNTNFSVFCIYLLNNASVPD